MAPAKTKPVALTDAQLALLRDVAAGSDKDRGSWVYGRSKIAAATKLERMGFLSKGSFTHWYKITDAGRAALKAPRAALCAGCDKVLPAHSYDSGHGYSVTIAPSVSVLICAGRRYDRGSSACRDKARERARRCPGCGAEDTDIGKICGACATNLERGQTLKDRKLEWWCIHTDGLGPYLKEGSNFHDRRDLLEELGKLLANALTIGRTTDSHSGRYLDTDGREIPRHGTFRRDGTNIYAELTHEQGEAAAALVQEIRRCLHLAHKKGYEEGDDALGRLAKGDTGVRDYEKHAVEVRKRLAEAAAEPEETEDA